MFGEKKNLSELTPFFQFMILSSLVLVFLVILQSLLSFSIPLLFDLGFDPTDQQMMDELMKRQDVMYFTQILYQLFFFLLPALTFAWLQTGNPLEYLRMQKGLDWRNLLLSLGIILTGNIFAYVFMHLTNILPIPAEIQASLEEQAALNEQLFKLFFQDLNAVKIVVLVFMIAIIPALAEEMLFRGVLQRFMGDYLPKYWIGLTVASILFGLAHGMFQSFLSLVFLGFLLGIIYWRTQNLWYVIAAHFLNNFLQLIYLFWADDESAVKLEDSEMVPLWISLLAGVFMSLLLYVLLKRTPPENILDDDTEGRPLGSDTSD